VFSLMECGVADFLKTLQIAAQGAHISPGDILRRSVEMLGVQSAEARQNSVDSVLRATTAARASSFFLGVRIGNSVVVAG
jgi:hypothetical protein